MVIACLARSHFPGMVQRAQEVLIEGVEEFPLSLVVIDSFNDALLAWAKNNLLHGPEKAGKLIILMDQMDNRCGSWCG